MKYFYTFLFLLIITGFQHDRSIDDHHSPYAFTNVNVIPMDEEQILENFTVITEEDRIVKLGPAGEIEIPSDAQIIDGKGKYLMPGLAEMHGHVPPNSGECKSNLC